MMTKSRPLGRAYACRGRMIRFFVPLCLLLPSVCLFLPAEGWAQGAHDGRVEGRVVAEESGAPLIGVHVRIASTDAKAGTSAVAGARAATATSRDGRFTLDRLPAGEHEIVFELVGRRATTRRVRIVAGETTMVTVHLEIDAILIGEVVVSVTGEAQGRARTAATVDVVRADAIRDRRPAHPSELMGSVPGVWVNVTGGEGHMTAIRQPLTTDPVYLYLEDGVPTRSTGFFNHNALYEVNLPQADRVEIVKGPVSALHGSDAIGGSINVVTRAAGEAPGLELNAEAGPDGWARLLGSYALTGRHGGLRADLNLMRTDGWREATGYDRRSATVRWDHELSGGTRLKSVIAWSRIDQQTAGSSRLPEALYRDAPRRNLTPISYREVQALRVSTELTREGERTLWSVTPFARFNSMEILPNWSLSYDPTVSETTSRSAGLVARVRRDFDAFSARLVAGVDVDFTPGRHIERRIDVVQQDGVYTEYTSSATIYDYDVTFAGVSPYLHLEASPIDRLRLTAGLRHDGLAYDYDNGLGALATGPHRRPASQRVTYTAASPKAGATFALGPATSLFVAYARGFRAPSQGQLFRQGVAENTVGLEPVVAINQEAGLRGLIGRRASYQLSVYRLRKEDDILTYQRADETRETQNAGATLHRGIEAGLSIELPAGLRLDGAWTWARHRYEAWSPAPGVEYDGHEMESAPRTLGTLSLSYRPGFIPGAAFALEWTRLGAYWLNPENTERYDGHDLLDARMNLPLGERIALFARLTNLADARYADHGGWSPFRGREFAPGRPRALFAGFQLTPGGER